MTIAIFTDTYAPEINGVTTSVRLLREELQNRGHTVYLFCPEYGGRVFNDDADTFRMRSIPYFFRKMKERRFVFPEFNTLFKVRRLNVDIIHSQVPGNIGVYGLIVSWLFNIPHVHTYHTLYMAYIHYMPIPKAVSTRSVRWISRKFLGRCQRVVAPSHDIRDELKSYGVDAPIDVIPTGIETRRTHAFLNAVKIKAKYGVPEDRPCLLYVGRLGPEKNVQFLFDVLLELRRRETDAHLLIVGDGPDRHRLEGLVRQHKLNADVTFAGYLPREEVFSFYRMADLFVFASTTETQGLVLLEAMSVGTPAVAVAEMGVGDLLSDGRGGIPVGAVPEEFANAVQSLLEDKELFEKKRAEAYAKADEWSVARSTDRLLWFYMESIRDYMRHGMPRHRDRPWSTVPEIDPDTRLPDHTAERLTRTRR
ncbi:MAG: glycosyltransferase family 4 protein [Spirochaetaceae bacterium]